MVNNPVLVLTALCYLVSEIDFGLFALTPASKMNRNWLVLFPRQLSSDVVFTGFYSDSCYILILPAGLARGPTLVTCPDLVAGTSQGWTGIPEFSFPTVLRSDERRLNLKDSIACEYFLCFDLVFL